MNSKNYFLLSVIISSLSKKGVLILKVGTKEMIKITPCNQGITI